MTLFKAGLILIVVMLVGVFAAADDDEKGKDAAETITMAELKDHMYFLASDFLAGRVVGSQGFEIATQYAISQLKAAGIKPVFKGEKVKPTYLQKFDLFERSYSDDAIWLFTNPAGEMRSLPGEKMRSFHIEGSGMIGKSNDLYFVGYGISEPDHGWDDLKGMDLKGKVVVVMPGAPRKDNKPVLPKKLDESYSEVDGWISKYMTFSRLGIKDMIFLHCDELAASWVHRNDDVKRTLYSLTGELAEEEVNSLIASSDRELSRFIMAGQEYSPYMNPENPNKGYKTFKMKNAGVELVCTKQEKLIETSNIIAVIPGTDEKLKDEYIVLGGHLDHIPPVKGEVCNGADDNASGSIAVMETAEALAKQQNKRSILICLWGAEEAGILGSSYFVHNSPIDTKKMKAHINLDMIARSDKDTEINKAIYLIGANNAAPEFAEFIGLVNANSVDWPVVFEDEKPGNGASDHRSFAKIGIPAVFFFSGYHEDCHEPTDDAENIDWLKFLNVSRLACNLVDSLANTDVPLDSYKKELAEAVH